MEPWVETHVECFEEPLALESGRVLPRFEIAWEGWGALDAERRNAILLCHTYSGDHHAAGRRHAGEEQPGWWDALIGPGRVLDTDRYFVLSSNCLGGSSGSTGPSSVDPESGRRYGMRFPVITMRDIVSAQLRLAERLGIRRFHSIIGGCFGGAQVLQWMADHPERLGHAVVVSATPRASVHTVALAQVARAAVRLDPRWRGGDYDPDDPPVDGIGLLTMFGSLFWQDRELLQAQFGPEMAEPRALGFDFEPEFAIERLLARLARPRNVKLDANSLLYLSRANDYFDLGRGRGGLAAALSGFAGRALLLGFRQDWRYPVHEMAELADALRGNGVPARHLVLDNAIGHAAFLREPECLEPHLAASLAEAEAAARSAA